MPPRKRKAEEDAEYRVPSPHDDDMLDEYKCSITHELPIEPVVAEDGHTYERVAIEEWLKKHVPTKSPMTNQPMGTKLVQALQTRNAIERLVQKGIIQGEAADKWRQRHEELQALDKTWREILYSAHNGEVSAMRKVGFAYRDGSHGFKKDRLTAIGWWQKAALQDCAGSITSLGTSRILGKGFSKDIARAMIDLTRGAMLGSEHGAVTIASFLAAGTGFNEPDEDAARWWYNYSKTCKLKDTTEQNRACRTEWFLAHGE